MVDRAEQHHRQSVGTDRNLRSVRLVEVRDRLAGYLSVEHLCRPVATGSAGDHAERDVRLVLAPIGERHDGLTTVAGGGDVERRGVGAP